MTQRQKCSKTAVEVEKKVTTFGENIRPGQFDPYAILMYHCMGTEAVSVYLCTCVFATTLQTSMNIFFEVQCCLGIITGIGPP